MKQAVIITTISEPAPAVRAFAQLMEWRLIVVADQKTPDSWRCPGAELISVDEQQSSAYGIAARLPWNHYARKMMGYLRAMEDGAVCIADTDDDNQPYEDWGFPPWQGNYRGIPGGVPWANVYAYFTDQQIWPRGFPLERINDPGAVPAEDRLELKSVRVGVWQGLVDGDPDVDAIYRLTVGKACRFESAEPVVLRPGTHSPFNSQNTLFLKELFPLLYLPALVTFRFTDILRGWVAQPVMWQAGFQLGFTRATVFQDRNPHDYLQDFESEIPVYLNAQRVIEIAEGAVGSDSSVSDNLARVYGALARAEIVSDDELRLLDAWLSDCQRLGC